MTGNAVVALAIRRLLAEPITVCPFSGGLAAHVAMLLGIVPLAGSSTTIAGAAPKLRAAFARATPIICYVALARPTLAVDAIVIHTGGRGFALGVSVGPPERELLACRTMLLRVFPAAANTAKPGDVSECCASYA